MELREPKKSFTIHDLPASERPRERLQQFGVEALSAQELLALILGRGIAGESVMVTAQRLLSQFGSLKGMGNASVEELAQVKGIGVAKASQLKAAFELTNRLEGHLEIGDKPLVKTPEASEDDVRMTRRLFEAGEIMGVEVLDHIIIGDKKYLSLKREGLF